MTDKQTIDFAVEVAQEAGGVLLKYFGTNLTRKIKTGPNDFATEADDEAEKLILDRLALNFPDDAVVAEESGVHGSPQAEYAWIVDPLDGTLFFASGQEDFSVMITRTRGLEAELAVIWNPKRKLLATALRNEGSFLNGRRVHLTGLRLDDKPLLVSRSQVDFMQGKGYKVRNCGASGNTLLALAGEGRAFTTDNGFIWDFAPPALLLAEAGWKVTDSRGRPFVWDRQVIRGHPGVIATEPKLHEELVKVLPS